MLEIAERLNNVDVVERMVHYRFRTGTQAKLQENQRFKYMPPVFSLVIESLVEDIKNVVEQKPANAQC